MATMAPMGATTNYTPSGSQTVTSHQAPAGLLDAAMVNLARLFQPKPVAAPPKAFAAGATTPSYSAPPKSAAQIAEERLRTAKATQAMKLLPMQTEAEALKMQAAANPAPVRATTFASGAINGYTTDPMAMNAYQRELYLPNGSAQAGDFGEAEGAARDKATFDFMDKNAMARSLRDAGDQNPWGTMGWQAQQQQAQAARGK